MRKYLFMGALALATLAALVPLAFANKTSVPNGTRFVLEVGEKRKITISGTKSCKFDVMTNSTNANAATVTPSDTQKTKHVVEITAVAPGDTNVTIMTANGSIPQCQGFTFSYSVEVTPPVKAAVDQAKGKLSDAAKDIADLNKQYVTDVNNELKALLQDRADADITTQEAIDDALDLFQDAYSGLVTDTNALLDDVDANIASRLIASGFTADNFPLTLVYGGCGIYDAFISKVFTDYYKTQATIQKAACKYFSDLNKLDIKLGGNGVTAIVPPAICSIGEGLQIAAAVNPAPPPKPKPNLAITWAASGHLTTDATSKLKTGGVADKDGGNVTVKLTGPGGSTSTQNVPVDNKGRWKANFSGLPSGDYVIEATQGTSGPVTKTHKVL